jgi:hypothetical protein
MARCVGTGVELQRAQTLGSGPKRAVAETKTKVQRHTFALFAQARTSHEADTSSADHDVDRRPRLEALPSDGFAPACNLITVHTKFSALTSRLKRDMQL